MLYIFRALKHHQTEYSPFLRGSENVAIEGGQDTEEKQIEQQFSVDELVEGTSPHKQKPGESTTGGTGDLVLIRDRHVLSIQEHRANFFSRTTRSRARCYSYFQKFSSVEPESEIVLQLQTTCVQSLEYFMSEEVVYSFSRNTQVYLLMIE